MTQRLPEGITHKKVPYQRALVIRSEAESQAEILHQIARLIRPIADYVIGPPLCRLLEFPRGDRPLQIAIAFPTCGKPRIPGYEPKEIPSADVLSIRHTGDVGTADGSTSFEGTWKWLAEFIVQSKILAGDDPIRYVYHSGPWLPGVDAAEFVTEIQVVYHLPVWLAKLEEGVRRAAGAAEAARVMAGSESLVGGFDSAKAAEWVRAAIARLDNAIACELERATILNECAHHHIATTREKLEEMAREAISLHTLVEKINERGMLAGDYWIDDSGDEPRLFVRRRPAYKSLYDEATTEAERRFYACYCPLVRDMLREGKDVSRTFCHCSGGWYVQEWEILLGRRPRVDLVETLLEGADSCVFAIHLRAEELE